MMAQRLFLTSISVSGQKEEWWMTPLNLSMPGQSGMYLRAAWQSQQHAFDERGQFYKASA
jgi:hypothetical protein